LKKYKTLIIFLLILAIWSFLFSCIKYFIWQDLNTTLKPDLQSLAWYLSLGAVFSYLIWWAVAYSFLKRYILAFLSFFVLLIISFIYFVDIYSFLNLWIVISLIGFLYGLWVVLRNIIVSIEIQKTWIKDTKLNALVNIIFIVFVILGTVLGSKLSELYNHNGLLVIIWFLIVLFSFSLSLDYDNVCLKTWIKCMVSKKYLVEKKLVFKNSLSKFIPEIKYIWKNFFYLIITSSIIWSIATIVSQKIVEISIDKFHMLASNASFAMLYSSLWAILWNIISSVLKDRWKSFLILNLIMTVLILFFLFFSNSFLQISILIFILWWVFGANSNLIDAYFLKKIWEEDKKEYWSATYGLVFSIVLFIMMFVASFIDKIWGYKILFVVLALILLLVSALFYKYSKSLIDNV